MEKKDLKFYEAPACDIVELKVNAQLLAGSPNPDDPFDGSSSEPDEIE